MKSVTDNNLAVKILEINLMLATILQENGFSAQFLVISDQRLIPSRKRGCLSFEGERSIPSEVSAQVPGLKTNCLCQFWLP